MNNIGSRGFGGGGGRGGWGGFGGGGGLRTNEDIGLNWGTAADKLETSGSVRYRYNGSDTRSETSSEDFVNKAGAFSNRNSVSLSSNSGVNANFRLEWKPDSMTNIIFRPAGSYSRNRGFSDNISASFKEDPYSYTQDPLSNLNDEVLKNVLVNSNIQTQQTYSNNSSMNGELQLNRRLNNEGRNITLRLTGSLGSSSSKQLSASDIKYYGTGISMPNNNNRYYDTPGRNSSYSIQATYSEPIAYRTYLQFSYRYNYSYTKNDRQAFTYKAEAYNEMDDLLHRYRYNVAGIVDHLLSLSEDNPLYKSTFDNSLSQYSEYNNYNHTATIMLRRTRDNYNFSIGIDLMPQRSHLDYKYLQTDTTVTRNVFNFAPRIDLRYKFNKTTNLQVGYNGRSSQPSMTNLLDIKDDSNPLNVTRGNTGLKPSFTHTVHAFFNTFQMEHQTNFFANVFGNIMQNSISNQMSYDEATGVRYTRPMNINGNWSVSGGFGGNTGVDRNNKFTIGSFSNVSYNNSVGFLGSGNNDNMGAKQTTKALNLSENLEFGYRDEWFDISLNGGITYNRSRNNQNKANNLDTYQFSYGSEIDVRTPIGLNFHTDISMQSRRGYAQESMNTNELLWNAQVSKSLLKGNALTISLEVNDILGRQSNISRTITALSRTDSRYNAIYQYGMLHAIYRLNIFGGKGARGGQGGGRGGWGGGFPGGGFPGGGFGGGFGGGRPGGRM
ncbi:MAG: outer membrane beta-barrel protein [Prevotellaceae bacterium]|nr:outer membrane beta-barrel protein [Candidatus Minthosoma caballi]